MLTVIVWKTSQASSWTISLGKRTSNFIDWQEYNQQHKELRDKKELERFKYFKDTLEEHPMKNEITTIEEDKSSIVFKYKDYKITFFPFTGWWQGNKGFGNGRGIEALFNRLEEK